jgi:energy-coupling factor transport system substrate-specific component
VQAIVMISLGYFGNHGAVSLLSYTIPGIAAELVSYLYKNKTTIAAQVSICLVANLSGTLIVTLLVMRLATIPLMISLVAGAISGILGGLLSFSLLVKLKQYRIV